MARIGECLFVGLLLVSMSTGGNSVRAGNMSPEHPASIVSRSKPVDFPTGKVFNLTFKSRIDGSFQPLLVKIPKAYTPQRSWPLLVTLHGLGDGPILAPDIESIVQIGPYGRGSVWFTGIGEQDVFECVETAKSLFNIDENRIYLCGFSMGAMATFTLGLSYPDIWAACVPVCGMCRDLDLVPNGRHLPFWIWSGQKDNVVPPENSKRAYLEARNLGFSDWNYTECENMGHSFEIDWKEVEKWLLTRQRVPGPNRVTFCTKTIKSNRAYWVELKEITEYGKNARIDVSIDGQKIIVATDNVSDYLLRPDGKFPDSQRRIQIVENNVLVFDGPLGEPPYFAKKKHDTGVFKRSGLCGPLWDVYKSSCILAYGTDTNDKSLITAARRCAESFANPAWMPKVTFKIVPDSDVSDGDLMQNNLVLFGSVNTNRILARISPALPVQMEQNRILARGVAYAGDNIGYVIVYPNPLNCNKYVAVFAGATAGTIDCFDRIWPSLNAAPKNIDFGIFEINDGNNSVKWLLKGLFGSNWQWQ